MRLQAKGSTRFAALAGGGHAAYAHHGDGHRARHVGDHPERHGEHRGPAEPARTDGDDGLAGAKVYAHPDQRVDEGHRVRAAVDHRLRHVRYGCDVGAEFDNKRLCDPLFDLINQVFCDFRIGAERHAAALDVGAADVELHRKHLVAGVERGGCPDIFLHAVPADIGDDLAAIDLVKPRDLLLYDGFDAGVLQTDGIDETGGALRDAGERIAVSRLRRRPFEAHGAEDVDVVIFGEFPSEPECAAGGDDGVFHLITEKFDGKILHHTTSSAPNTGPSLHTRA